jgi:hypothetical protein
MQRLDLVCTVTQREALDIAVDKKIEFVIGDSCDDRFPKLRT